MQAARIIAIYIALFWATLFSAHGSFASESQHGLSGGTIQVTNAWARETFPMARTGAGYLTITNLDKVKSLHLLGVRAEGSISQSAELHTVEMSSGMMKMFELKDGIWILPGETVELQPGGMHIMFIGLNTPFNAGENVPVSLIFNDHENILINLPVKDVRQKVDMD